MSIDLLGLVAAAAGYTAFLSYDPAAPERGWQATLRGPAYDLEPRRKGTTSYNPVDGFQRFNGSDDEADALECAIRVAVRAAWKATTTELHAQLAPVGEAREYLDWKLERLQEILPTAKQDAADARAACPHTTSIDTLPPFCGLCGELDPWSAKGGTP